MSAIISPCGQYRYALHRKWSDGSRTVAFIGVNPSTADATTDDATVRKWRGFAQRWGFDGFIAGNLFAYRSTDVRVLADLGEAAIGTENNLYLATMLRMSHVVVPCWGDRAKLPKQLHGRIDTVRCLLRMAGLPVQVLGLTSNQDPKHPLMLSYSTPLQHWSP